MTVDHRKRVFDIVVASLALTALSPIMIATALAVRLRMGSPVFFRQPRPGLHGEMFSLLKFRSMREGDGTDEERLGAFGRKLRASSLDELPELLNVLKGDMSLVGPRPLLPHYLELYNDEQARRHEVRPGITGLAQINGRNLLSWEHRFELDVAYVDRRSLRLDVEILLRTVGQVVRRDGISAEGRATMPPFRGTAG